MNVDFENIRDEKPVLKLLEVILNFGKNLSYSKDFIKTYISFDKISGIYNGCDDDSPFIFEIDLCYTMNILLYLSSGNTIDMTLYNSKSEVIEYYNEELYNTEEESKEDLDFIEESLNDEIFNTVDGQIMTCDKLYENIDRQIAGLSANAENQIKGQLGLAANTTIDTVLGSIGTDLFNYQQGQTMLLQNAMMLNTFSDAYANLGSSLGMEENALGYGMAKAQETAKMTGAMQAIQAKKYLPTAKGYMTVIFVALIPFIIIIALITSNFKKPFAMIFGLLLALALWNIGEQLLDFIIIVRTKTLFMNSGLSAYNLESQPFLSSGITDMLNLSLSMYWMIPTLAFSVATLSGFGAASMMGSISGIATAGVSGAAAEAATGSMSAGNIRMSNINMNKYDAAQNWSAGTSSKLSLENQRVASNQSSALTGTRNIHDKTDSLKHEGTTFMRNQDGELLRMTGNFEQTGGAWKFSGNVQNLSTGETYTGNMSGMAKDMNSMQQGLNIDDVSMTGKGVLI